jgi:hypothetical protein
VNKSTSIGTQKFNLQPSPLLSLQLIFQDSSRPPVTLILEEGQPEACYLLCCAKEQDVEEKGYQNVVNLHYSDRNSSSQGKGHHWSMVS